MSQSTSSQIEVVSKDPKSPLVGVAMVEVSDSEGSGEPTSNYQSISEEKPQQPPQEEEEAEPWPMGRAIIGGTLTFLICAGLMAGIAVCTTADVPDTQQLRIWGWATSAMLSALISMGINLIAWVAACILVSERFYDLTGGITNFSLVAISLAFNAMTGDDSLPHARQWVVSCMGAVWAIRLGGFLFMRIHRVGKDGRFDALKQNPMSFLIPWALQAQWCFLNTLSIVIINGQRRGDPLNAADFVGWAIWALGFALEVIADRQKDVWSRDPANKGKWIDVGLWSLSRHPNYCGEITLWLGLTISGCGIYKNGEWIAFITPVFVYLLLTRISGVNLQDDRAFKKWGSNKEYLAYRKRTWQLVPLPKCCTGDE